MSHAAPPSVAVLIATESTALGALEEVRGWAAVFLQSGEELIPLLAVFQPCRFLSCGDGLRARGLQLDASRTTQELRRIPAMRPPLLLLPRGKAGCAKCNL